MTFTKTSPARDHAGVAYQREEGPTVHLSENLVGRRLKDGWKVIEKVAVEEGMTGANFSIGYKAKQDSGREGFVKVLDISKASSEEDPARRLEEITTAFNFERDILQECRSMSRVVSALSEGTVTDIIEDRVEVAQYIIFELAESDLRQRALLQSYDNALNMRILHHVAIGLAQLHGRKIAHQDVKPSNILLFEEEGSKIADLGRSSISGRIGPHDEWDFPGDANYAPPELIYGQVSDDWNIRRRASDLFQLGSLVVFAFCGVGLRALLLRNTHRSHRPSAWSGTYDEVLAYLERYFRNTISQVTSHFPAECRADLQMAVVQLCCLDPRMRGHPKSRAEGNPYGLERYISLFNRLAITQEWQMRRGFQ